MRARPYVTAIVCLLALALPATTIRAQTGRTNASRLPRAADGKPDLQGIWQVQNRAAEDLQDHAARPGMPAAKGVVDGGEIPYQPAAAAKKRQNFAGRQTADPLLKCYMPGVPRIMYLDSAFQIFQTPTHIAETFAWSHLHRLIYVNDSKPPAGIDFWMGDSRGHWEGDTLVVEVTNHNDRTWLDAAGDFHSDALRVVERYTMLDVNTIQYEATITDPKIFTRPWTIRMPFHRQTRMKQLPEYDCAAQLEERNGTFARDTRTWPPAAPLASTPVVAAPQASARAASAIRATADRAPDLQGYFNPQAPGANFGLEVHAAEFGIPAGKGFIVDPADGKLPMQDWARAEKQTRVRPERGYDDPAAHCFPNGLPRSMYTGGFQILQPPGYVVFLMQGDTGPSYRIIALDGRPHAPASVHLWQGDSVGHWDGNTLVVETTNLNGKSWLNQAGEVVSYQETVLERFTSVDANTISYQATVTDPLVYTRPWTIAYSLTRSQDELLEVACREDNDDLEHLRQVKESAATDSPAPSGGQGR